MVVINLKLFSIFTEINFLKEITLLSPRIMISLPRMMSNFDIIRKKNTSHICWVSKKLPILFKNLSSRKCTRSLNLEGKKEKGQEKEMQNWNTKEKTTTTKTWKKKLKPKVMTAEILFSRTYWNTNMKNNEQINTNNGFEITL